MRASDGSRHISGAERLVPASMIESVVREVVGRAMAKGRPFDRISVTVDSLGDLAPRELPCLKLITLKVPDPNAGREAASRLLQKAGVSEQAASSAISLISRGAAPSGGNMRGAMVMDAATGERLEQDRERGVRASRFDWTNDVAGKITSRLAELGLFHARTREALALATKVAHAPAIVAELCWSDDEDYTAGYVAAPEMGYVRFPCMKHPDDPFGGRAFFVNRSLLDIDVFMGYLRNEPVLIGNIGECRPEMDVDSYFDTLR